MADQESGKGYVLNVDFWNYRNPEDYSLTRFVKGDSLEGGMFNKGWLAEVANSGPFAMVRKEDEPVGTSTSAAAAPKTTDNKSAPAPAPAPATATATK